MGEAHGELGEAHGELKWLRLRKFYKIYTAQTFCRIPANQRSKRRAQLDEVSHNREHGVLSLRTTSSRRPRHAPSLDFGACSHIEHVKTLVERGSHQSFFVDLDRCLSKDENKANSALIESARPFPHFAENDL